MMTRWIGRACVVAAALFAAPVNSQDFPQRPITFVVGLGAGTITDWMNALPKRLQTRSQS